MSYFIDKYYALLLMLLTISYCDANLWFASYVSNCYNLCFSVESCIIQCQNGFKSSHAVSNNPSIGASKFKKSPASGKSIKSFSGLWDYFGSGSKENKDRDGDSDSDDGGSSGGSRGFAPSPQCGLKIKNRKHATHNTGTDSAGMQRIVGGEDAQPNEFPWIVSFQIREASGSYKHFCAGAVLTDYYVITAAHCLFQLVGQEKRIKLKAGINDYHDKGQTMTPVKFIIHEGWNEKTQTNDIALIRVKKAIKYTTNMKNQYLVNSVCLNEDPDEPKNYANLAGWGKLGEDEPQSDWLQKIELPMWDRAKCKENYVEFMKINENHICAGGKGGQDSCMGDSGGPLTQTRSSRGTLIGVVSFGVPCAVKGLPGVYTHIYKYLDWIKSHAV